MKQLNELRDRRAKVQTEAKAILAKAADEGHDDLGDEEELEVSRLETELDDLEAQIADLEKRADRERKFTLVDDYPAATGGVPRLEDDPFWGWGEQGLGAYCQAVRTANPHGGQMVIDERLRLGAAPSSPANEGSGQDGGYLIPPGFSMRVYQHSLEEDAFLPLTDNTDITGNTMSFPKDETTPWGSNGVRAYWEAEGAQATQSAPVLGRFNLRLNKLFALVPMTDELLDDAGALGAYVERKAGESIRWKTNDALMNGDGAGTPEGIANAGALIAQAKESTQAADTLKVENIVKMFARSLSPGRSVWLINPDAWSQLPLMTIGDMPVFVPPGIQGTPGGSLLGRPVIMTDTCKTLGDKGDLYFVDWMAYNSITKAGGIQTATSMHLWFDYDVSAFRATFRVDGQPWLAEPITPPNSTVKRSSFVTLAARA